MRFITIFLIFFALFFPVTPARAAAPTDFVSCYELDETSGTRVDANTTNSNDLADNNTVLSTTGKQGNAANFETTATEYLSITDASQTNLDITGDMSINFWVNFESLTTARIINKANFASAERSFSFLWVNTATDYLRMYMFDGTTEYEPTVAWTPSTATWYMLTVVYDASAGTQDYYVNGSQQGVQQTGAVTSMKNSTADFTIGAAHAGELPFDGFIDIAEIYNRTLTTDEITALYVSGSGVTCAGRAASEPEATTTPHAVFHGSTVISGNTVAQ